MKEKIIALIGEVKDNTDLLLTLDGHSNINELGMDSLQMLNFILMVEDEFSIEIDFDKFNFSDIGSIDNFCEFIDLNSKNFG